jgi:hypothetical protein
MADPLTAEQQRERRQAIPDIMTKSPFIGGLGVVFERYEPDPPGSGHDPAPVPRRPHQ